MDINVIIVKFIWTKKAFSADSNKSLISDNFQAFKPALTDLFLCFIMLVIQVSEAAYLGQLKMATRDSKLCTSIGFL